jgi:hypothetical protein
MPSAGFRRRAIVAIAIALGGLAASSIGQTNDDTVVLSAKLDAEGLSQMLVPIRINGHTFWCNADSGGSRVLSLDIAKAIKAGLQPNASGTNAGVGPEVSRDQRIRGAEVAIGPVVLPDTPIVLVPRPPVVPDIDCVLGLGLLPAYAVEFDYLTPSVRLIPSARFRPSEGAVSIPITVDRVAMPSAKVQLRIDETSSVDATLTVDTGASYYDVVLLKPFIDGNRVSERIGTIVPRFSDTPGMMIAAARAAAVTVGSFEVRGPVTALISTRSGGTFVADGLLGTGFLRRFKVTFDYSRQQLWLEPNGRWREPQLFDASGTDLRPTDAHEIVVVAVGADSAASAAGLRVGDVLKQVDGRPVSTMTLGDIQEAFFRSDQTCTIQIARDGHLQTATLRLRRRL